MYKIISVIFQKGVWNACQLKCISWDTKMLVTHKSEGLSGNLDNWTAVKNYKLIAYDLFCKNFLDACIKLEVKLPDRIYASHMWGPGFNGPYYSKQKNEYLS